MSEPTYDPERALFIPGRRSFLALGLGAAFAAAFGVGKPDLSRFVVTATEAGMVEGGVLVTPEWVTREIARGFVQSLKFAQYAARPQPGVRIGDTVRCRLQDSFQLQERLILNG